MLNTFPVGFVFGAMPGPEGYHFDCGCALDAQGRAFGNRPPLESSHLHFVTWPKWETGKPYRGNELSYILL